MTESRLGMIEIARLYAKRGFVIPAKAGIQVNVASGFDTPAACCGTIQSLVRAPVLPVNCGKFFDQLESRLKIGDAHQRNPQPNRSNLECVLVRRDFQSAGSYRADYLSAFHQTGLTSFRRSQS